MELSNVSCALVVVPEVQIVLEVQPEIPENPAPWWSQKDTKGRVKKKHLKVELVLSNIQRFREIPCKTPGQPKFSTSSAHKQLSVTFAQDIDMHAVLIEKNPLPKSITPNV